MAEIVNVWKADPQEMLDALAEINESLEENNKQQKKNNDEAEKGGKKGVTSANQFAGALKGVAVGAAAAAAAIALVVKETLGLSVALNKIDKGAKAVGATNAEFQILEGTLGRVTDGSLKTVNVMGNLNKRLGDAAKGAGPAYEALEKLGLTAEELSKLDTPEQLAVIGDEIAELGTQAEKSKVQADLFGGAGKALGAAFANGGADIRAAAAEVENIGLVSDEAIAQAAALQDTMDGLSQVFLVLKTDVLGPLLPVLTETANEIQKIISEASEAGDIETFGDALVAIVDSGILDLLVGTIDLITKLGPAFKLVAGIFEQGTFVFVGALEALVKLLQGDVLGSMEAVFDVLAKMFVFPVTAIKAFISLLQGDTAGALEDLKEGLAVVTLGMVDLTEKTVDGIREVRKLNDMSLDDFRKELEEVGLLAGNTAARLALIADIKAGTEKYEETLNKLTEITEGLAFSGLAADDKIIESTEKRAAEITAIADEQLKGLKEGSDEWVAIITARDAAINALLVKGGRDLDAYNEKQKKVVKTAKEFTTFDIPDVGPALDELDKLIAKSKEVGLTIEEDIVKVMTDLIGQAAAEGVAQVEAEMDALRDSVLTGVNDTLNTIGILAGATADLFNAIQDERVESAELTKNKIEGIEEKLAGNITYTERKRLEEEKKIEEERLAKQKEGALVAFGIAKGAAIAEAAVSLALGIVNSLAAGGALGIALAAATGIAGGIAIAAIAAEPPPSFHTGGMLSSDEMNFVGRQGEAVLNPAAVSAVGGEQGVNNLNRGSSSGQNQPIFTIFNVGNKTTDAMVTENLRTKRGPLSEKFRTTQPTNVKITGHAVPKSFQ